MTGIAAGLRLRICQTVATGEIDGTTAAAMLGIFQGASLLKLSGMPNRRSSRIKSFQHTLDLSGNLLVAGGKYLYKGQVVKVLREEYGQGNISDVYQRVYYLNHNKCEKCVEVAGTFPNGILEGAVFNSKFEPCQRK